MRSLSSRRSSLVALAGIAGVSAMASCTRSPAPAPPAPAPPCEETPAAASAASTETAETAPVVPETGAEAKSEADKELEPALALEPVAMTEIPGWGEDQLGEAIPPLLRSCRKLERYPDERSIGPDGVGGTAADWKPVCRAAKELPGGDQPAARRFFEAQFEAYLATNRGDPEARFTGYYEALMKGARKRRGRYRWPIYKRPPELVMVHLKQFYDSPRPRRVAGRVVRGTLRPYYTRAEIMNGALRGRGLELYWVTSPVDAFFAQIQGSGIVELPNGKRVRVGYAGKNGHPYTAIGRVLVREEEMTREEMSMQSIRRWLEEDPARAQKMMARNRAFVFFRREKRQGAIGAQGLVLTPERSIAIDPYFLPLSAPLFVDAEIPDPEAEGETRPFRQLVIAQDTGGAIRGPVRGDIFWGAGERAFSIAGRLKARGRLYLLLPKTVRPNP